VGSRIRMETIPICDSIRCRETRFSGRFARGVRPGTAWRMRSHANMEVIEAVVGLGNRGGGKRP